MKNQGIRLSVICLILSISVMGQAKFDKSKISKEIIEIVQKIKKINTVMEDVVGYEGVRPKQFDHFEDLEKKATKNELMELTNHPNGAVRCYAFWALAYKVDVQLFPIVLKHLDDNEIVETMSGCIIEAEKVGDFFIRVVTPRYFGYDTKKLSPVQLKKLDIALIYTPNKLYATAEALNRVEITEKIYPRIRELYVEENNQTALVVLAKYKKKQDIELILNNESVGYSYRAIINFPHLKFLPLLEINLKDSLEYRLFRSEGRNLYKAIAQYKNQKALKLLKIPFTRIKDKSIRPYHLDYLYEAISIYKDPIYDNLYWKLWIEENRIGLDLFKYLLKRDPKKTYKMTERSLTHLDQIKLSNDLIIEMYQLLIKQDRDLAFEIIRQNIMTANVHQFRVYAKMIPQLNDPSFIKPLFQRLEIEANAHVYLRIAEVLIGYRDKKINQRLAKSINSHQQLREGWGGKALKELLKKKGIILD